MGRNLFSSLAIKDSLKVAFLEKNSTNPNKYLVTITVCAQAEKIKIELDKKLSLFRNRFFFRVCNKLPNWHFKNQAQLDTVSFSTDLSVLEIWVFLNQVYFKLENKSSCDELDHFSSLIITYLVIIQLYNKKIKIGPIFDSWSRAHVIPYGNSHCTVVVWLLSRIGCFIRDNICTYKSCLEGDFKK